MLGEPAEDLDLDPLDRTAAEALGEAPELLAERHERRQRLHGLRADRRDVDRIGDDAAGQRGDDLLGGDDPGAILGLRRRGAQMRRHDHVVAAEDRMIGHRLGREHVQRRAADRPVLERLLERLEVDQLTAGTVDDPDAVLHLRQRLGIDPVDRLRRLRQVDRDQVGAGVELVDVADPFDAELLEALGGDELVERDDVHVERQRSPGDELADPAETDHAERLAIELVAAEARARPLAVGEGGVRLRNVAEERQGEGQRVLRRRNRIGFGGVGNHDSPLRRRFDVDVVDAGARPADRTQGASPADQLGGHLGGRADQDRVELADPLLQLAGGPIDAHLDVEPLAQQVDAGFGDLLLDQDLRPFTHRVPPQLCSLQVGVCQMWLDADQADRGR